MHNLQVVYSWFLNILHPTHCPLHLCVSVQMAAQCSNLASQRFSVLLRETPAAFVIIDATDRSGSTTRLSHLSSFYGEYSVYNDNSNRFTNHNSFFKQTNESFIPGRGTLNQASHSYPFCWLILLAKANWPIKLILTL